jgi:hypothetical protein
VATTHEFVSDPSQLGRVKLERVLRQPRIEFLPEAGGVAFVLESNHDVVHVPHDDYVATFLRWRPDKQPPDCRYDQLEVTPPYQLDRVFSTGSS